MSTQQGNISVELKSVSSSQANRWLKETLFDGQRILHKDHVLYLSSLMKKGRYEAGSRIDFARLDGLNYLVNGQHSLSAVIHSGVTTTFTVQTHVCDNVDRICELYSSFDRVLTRSPGEALAPYNLTAKLGLSPEMIQRLYAGSALATAGIMPYLSYGKRYPRVGYFGMELRDIQTRARMIEFWGPSGRRLIDDMAGAPLYTRRAMLRHGVLAVALITYRIHGEASDFWQGFLRDDRLSQGDPRKTLLHFLQSQPRINAGSTLARYVALAWNAAYEDQPRKMLRVTNANLPITIKGTPHDGTAHYVYMDAQGHFLQDPKPFVESAKSDSSETLSLAIA
jgi:hypothetical protein